MPSVLANGAQCPVPVPVPVPGLVNIDFAKETSKYLLVLGSCSGSLALTWRKTVRYLGWALTFQQSREEIMQMLGCQEERSSISCLTAFLDLGIMHEIVSWLIRKTSDIFPLNLIWFIFLFFLSLSSAAAVYVLAGLTGSWPSSGWH